MESFNEGLAMWLPVSDKYPVVPGLWFARGKSPEEGAAIVRQQIESAIEKTGHFCVFSYASLFGSRNPTRREILLPFLQSLAK